MPPANELAFGRHVANDLESITDYLRARSEDVAVRFVDAVRETLEDILQFPGMGSPKDVAEDQPVLVRSWRIRGFPKHLIFYTVAGERVRVVAVLHGARNVSAILKNRA